METKINTVTKDENTTYVNATCGKVSASVFFGRYGVQVCCHNASNRAWGGMGKRFETIADAMNGYKSAEMKEIIAAAAGVN